MIHYLKIPLSSILLYMLTDYFHKEKNPAIIFCDYQQSSVVKLSWFVTTSGMRPGFPPFAGLSRGLRVKSKSKSGSKSKSPGSKTNVDEQTCYSSHPPPLCSVKFCRLPTANS